MADAFEIGLPAGEFAVKVPEGNCKILAERFDGLYQSSFYTGPKANDGVVTIQSDVSDIDFVLDARPTATVKVKLLENGDPAKPVKYAWFDFTDPEDEFAPIVFPHLEGINFEDEFDGSYTLSVPEGDYKLAIGAIILKVSFGSLMSQVQKLGAQVLGMMVLLSPLKLRHRSWQCKYDLTRQI